MAGFRFKPGSLLLAFWVLAFGVLLSSASLAAPPEEKQLEEFLARLGLTDLQVLQLERMVARESANSMQQVELAKRLADLYASQLMAAADDAAKYDAVMTKIKDLIARVPRAETASLGVILLQADYNRAEGLVSKWISDPKQTQARDEAAKILREITPNLTARRNELKKQVETLIAELDKLENENRLYAAKEKELLRIQAVAGRASYFAAWANYYNGLLLGDPGKANVERGRDIFKDVLGIDEGYDEVDPEWLALESIWRSRSMIGLGLAEAALGNLAESEKCFNLLRHASVSPEIQDQAPYWRLRGLLNAGKWNEALTYAKGEVATFSDRATQGKVSLCVALVRAGYAPQAPTPTQKEMGELGITGLAKLGQQKAIGQLVEQLSIPMENPQGFYLNWIKGRQYSDQAKKERDKEKYRLAAESMEKALKASDAKANVLSAANCRYELGWCYYQLGDYEPAGRNYEQALIGLKAANEGSAADAAWMAFVSYNKLAATQRRFASRAIDVLRRLKADFPNNKYAKKADYFITKLQRSAGTPQEAIRDLMAIPESDPNYLSARYDLCVVQRQLWQENKSAATARDLITSIDQFAPKAKDPRRKLRVLLMAAEVAASQEPPDWSEVQKRVSAAAPLLSQVSANDTLAAEYHYRKLQLATNRKNETDRRAAAQWLVDNAGGTVYELPALVITAKALEKRYSDGGGNDAGLRNELIDVFRRLSTSYGNSPAKLKDSKNARVAASRLAQYQLDAGRPSEASRVLQQLLAAFPNESDYVRRAGLAKFQEGDFAGSLEHWRVLVRGLPKGKESWCESKYYQMACLAKTDREGAIKIFKQFKLLYPDFGHATHRAKFQQLARSLGL